MVRQERWPVLYGGGGGVAHTRATDRVVLAVVHSVAAGRRLADALPVVEESMGVQVVFTRPPGSTGDGVAELLRSMAVLEAPWRQAVRERFDLVVTTSPTGVAALDTPVLLLAGGTVDGRPVDHNGRSGITTIRGLLRRGNAPLLLGLPHVDDVKAVREQFPDIGQHALLVGDPSFDRLLRTTGRRAALRAEFGVRPRARAGLVLSSRGPRSLFGRSPDLVEDIARTRQNRADRVFCQLHPDVWTGHGRRQVLAWSAAARRAGVVFVSPWRDWRDPLVAADYVIGDHGIVTSYAVAMGKPVFLAHPIVPDPYKLPVLDRSRDLASQFVPGTGTGSRYQLVTSAPCRSSSLLRRAFRELLRFPI